MTTPYDIINWIEKHTTLHTTVEVVYVVDGYEVSVLNDRSADIAGPWHGKTVFDALNLAMKEYP